LVVLVVHADKTPREQVLRACKTLETAGAGKMRVGVILNQWNNALA
jgi:hypothetical protein